MRVPLRWLEEFVAVDVPIEKLVELLDLSGTKVEAVHRPARDLSGVIVAQVEEILPHPNADTLTLVDIKTESGESQRVVCGAKNFKAGDLVPLAQVGARLPEMEITERKIRGEVSRGMLCSSSELGVSSDYSGILVLPSDAQLGDDVVSVLGLDDTVLELELTPNRPDCMSIFGMAREISAVLGNELKEPERPSEPAPGVTSPVKVAIEDARGCPRYVARYIQGVEVAPSPGWMQARLLRVGVRPVSNVVDVTNYVLFELGQPLHAFDADRVTDQRIIVRRAKRGETMVTLDGQERTLHPDDLLIAGRKDPLAVAGVMGGGDSEVTDATKNVILESAHFDPASVAFTSRRHGLRSEASARFERGTDPEMARAAADRAADLMSSLAGGRISSDVTDEYPVRIERTSIRLRPERVGRVLGAPIGREAQISHLRHLGLGVDTDSDVLTVQVPTFRPDLKREIDLVEEVGRLAGFERLPATLPPGRTGRLDRTQKVERSVRTTLASLGLFEAWTSSFVSEKDLERLGVSSSAPAAALVSLANPMTEDERALRTSLLPGLLRSVALNERQRATGIALFELARIYEPSDEELPHEALALAGAVSGERRTQGWGGPPEKWGFFEAKGVLEALFDSLGVTQPDYSQAEGLPFHPTRAASISIADRTVGAMGELHPDVLRRWDIERPVVVFELALAPVFSSLPGKIKVADLSRFPSNNLDLAVVIDEDVSADAVSVAIREAGAPEVAAVRLFDLYRGDQISAGKKSLAFALELRSDERTLTDEEAVAVRDRIVSVLTERFGAALRS